MKQWRALWAAMALWAFFGWIYVVLRILLNGSDAWWTEEFIMGIPISFYMIGIGAYVIGFIATWRALVNGTP